MANKPIAGLICKYYNKLIYISSHLQSVLLLVLRLYFGYRFFQTGMGKLQNIDNVVKYFTSLGIPFPELNVYLAASTECIGGLLLLVGFASRAIAIPLSFTMIVAYATAHSDALFGIFENSKAFIKQEPFPFLLTALLVLAFGPGKFSIDGLIKARGRKYHSQEKPACCSEGSCDA